MPRGRAAWCSRCVQVRRGEPASLTTTRHGSRSRTPNSVECRRARTGGSAPLRWGGLGAAYPSVRGIVTLPRRPQAIQVAATRSWLRFNETGEGYEVRHPQSTKAMSGSTASRRNKRNHSPEHLTERGRTTPARLHRIVWLGVIMIFSIYRRNFRGCYLVWSGVISCCCSCSLSPPTSVMQKTR